MIKSKFLPPRYFVFSLLALIALHFLLPLKKIIPAPYSYLGSLLIIFGAVLNLWADQQFKKRKTTVKPYQAPTAMETTGPFCLSRHPMYLGMTAILLGAAVICGTAVTFIFPVLFVVLMELMFIPFEELNMAAVFGREYKEYKKKVRRWI